MDKHTSDGDTHACIMCANKTTLVCDLGWHIKGHKQVSIVQKQVHVYQTPNRNVYLTNQRAKYAKVIEMAFTK